MSVIARPLKPRVVGPSAVAKIDGPCPFCPHRIRAGIDFIAEVQPNGKWGHTHCANGYAETINEHLEDAAA